jgi:hypothetical protein
MAGRPRLAWISRPKRRGREETRDAVPQNLLRNAFIQALREGFEGQPTGG